MFSLNLHLTKMALALHFRSQASPVHVLLILIVSLFGHDLVEPNLPFIYRLYSCTYYFRDKTPGRFSPEDFSPQDPGVILPEKCKIIQVEQLVGGMNSVLGVIESLAIIISITMMSRLLSTRGRRPCLLMAGSYSCVGSLAYLASIYWFNSGFPSFMLFVLGLTLRSLFGEIVFVLLAQTYIGDTTETNPSSRASWFSILRGLMSVGKAASFSWGGYAATSTGKLATPFWISLGCFVSLTLYVFLFVPESLSQERRSSILMSRNERMSNISNSVPQHEPVSRIQRTTLVSLKKNSIAIAQRLNVFKTLKVATPRIQDEEGERYVDYRVTWGVAAYFSASLSQVFVVKMLLLLVTGEFEQTAAETGYLLGLVKGTKALFLLLIFPFLTKLIQRLYSSVDPYRARPPTPEESRLLENDDPSDDSNSKSNRISWDNLWELLLARCSYVIASLAMVGIGLSNTITQLVLAIVLYSFESGGTPVVTAYLTQVAEKDSVDQVIAAVAMCDSLAALVAPITLGSIYTLTVANHSRSVWFAMAFPFLTAASLLMLPGKRWMSRSYAA